MNNSQYIPTKKQKEAVICYARHYEPIFTSGEIILLHQWVEQNITPPGNIIKRFVEWNEKLISVDFDTPEITYNEDLRPCIVDLDTGKKIIIQNLT